MDTPKDMSTIVAEISAEIVRKFPSDSKDAHCWVKRVENCGHTLDYTICDLKPLAELLGCDPEMGAITERVGACVSRIDELVGESNKLYSGQHSIAEMLGCKNDVWAIMQIITALQVGEEARDRRLYAAIAQALNWERTEFDTLDELLGEIREQEQAHSNFVDQALAHYDLTDVVREKLCLLAETLGSTPLLDEAIELMAPRRYDDGPATTHTLLHAGELYREVTILLHTEQLVAWRTADGQEYSSPAHQVLLDPDEDGLAAELLSRIAGVEIAPEHMAELRAQMTGGVK